MPDDAAFQQANTPGRGSDVGDFVRSKKGGWVPKNHPDAIGNDAGGPVTAPPLAAADPAGGAGGGGFDVATMAMSGLQGTAPPEAQGFQELAGPGGANPALGNRILPLAMRQLALMPRVY
jgi:hypothetical protein